MMRTFTLTALFVLAACEGDPAPFPAQEDFGVLALKEGPKGRQLVWVDREGEPALLSEGPVSLVRLSPDRRDGVFTVDEEDGTALFVTERDAGRLRARRVAELSERDPLDVFWSPDRETLAVSFVHWEGYGMKVFGFDRSGTPLFERRSAPRLWGFTSDSEHFVLSYWEDQWGIVLVDVAADQDRVVNSAGEVMFDNVRISPARTEFLAIGHPPQDDDIGFTPEGELYFVDPADASFRRATHFTEDEELQVGYAVFGPTGDAYLAVEEHHATHGQQRNQIYVVGGAERPEHLWSAGSGSGEALHLILPAADGAVWTTTHVANDEQTRLLSRLSRITPDGERILVMDPDDYGAEEEARELLALTLRCDGVSAIVQASSPVTAVPESAAGEAASLFFEVGPTGKRQRILEDQGFGSVAPVCD